jgi:hypothetical protein
VSWSSEVHSEAYRAYLVFRGNFRDVNGAATAPFVVGNRYVVHPNGLILGRARFGEISSGIPEALGAPAERFAASMEIDNSDFWLSDALIGTTTAAPQNEYKSDSVINLEGVIYHGVKGAAGYFEQAITPKLYVSAEPVYDGTRVTLPLSSKDDLLLGPSYRPITLRMLKESADSGVNVSRITRDGTSGSDTEANWWEGKYAITDNLEELAAWPYGWTAIPLMRMNAKENPPGDGRMRMLVGVFDSSKEPDISGFPNWRFFSETYEDNLAWTVNKKIAPGSTLSKAKRIVTLADGVTTTTVWVLWVTTWKITRSKTDAEFPNTSIVDKQQYVVPSSFELGVSDGSVPPPPRSSPRGAAGLIEPIVKQHCGNVLDATSLARTKKAVKTLGWGGIYYGDTPVRDIIANIQEAAGIIVWTGINGSVYMAPNNGWNADDKTAAEDPATYHIRQTEVVQGWKETIPRDPDSRAGAATRVEISWPGEIIDVWKNMPGGLMRRAPSATVLPLGATLRTTIPGAWIYPPNAVDALSGAASRRTTLRRRISFVGRAWLAAVEKGTIMLLSYSRGLGPGGSTGYDRRPVRLERCIYKPKDDLCEVVFEDLGSVASIHGCRLDGYGSWLYAAGSGNLTVSAGSTTVVTAAAFFTAAMVGRYLTIPGSINRANKRARKITVFTDNKHVTVERQYDVNEVIGAGFIAGSAVIDAWAVVRAHSIEGASYRPDYFRNCVEATGVFRNGDVGYQLTAG